LKCMRRTGFTEMLSRLVRLLTDPPLQNPAKTDHLRAWKLARMGYKA
jgi:hypothetical protein